MKKAPEQVVYDLVFRVSEDLGFNTFDYLPANKVVYPFVFVGEVIQEDRFTKSTIFGNCTVTLHVFHNYKKRREVTDMLALIKRELFKWKESETLYLNLNRGDMRFFMDDSTSDLLLHGILELEFTFH